MTLKEKGKPTIFLWGDYREKNTIARKKYDQETLSNYDNLIDEVYRLVETKKLKDNTKQLFETNFSNKHQEIAFSSGDWLFQLAHYFEDINNLVKELFESKATQVRLRIVQNLMSYQPPVETVNKILSLGLKDTKKIRTFAIERIVAQNKKEFLSDIKQLLVEEQNPNEIEFLNRNIGLLENGFSVEEDGTDNPYVTYKTEDGYRSERKEKTNPLTILKNIFK
jgi:hypothetical protein